MSNFDNIALGILDVCESVFWDAITYDGNVINAYVVYGVPIEKQDGIDIVDATIVVKKTDVATVTAGKLVQIGAVQYRTGSQVGVDAYTYTIEINKLSGS